MSQTDCALCAALRNRKAVCEFGTAFALIDLHPVTTGHQLIVTKRHAADFFSMTPAERRDAEALLLLMKKQMTEKDPQIVGFNIGMNCGKAAGQTVCHAHYHLIPRRQNDVEDPRGGIRGCVPDKMRY